MNKLFAVVLLVAVLVLPALPAAAMPFPPRYFIDAEGLCIAPDADGVPTVIEGASTAYWYEKGGRLVMRCSGALPDWGAEPKQITKLDYSTTGLLCAGKMKTAISVTADYGALVYPGESSGLPARVDITCRFGFSPQAP